MKNLKYIGLVLLAVSFSACDVNNKLDPIPETPVVLENPNKGTADFSKFVSVGNSLTAGFTDNALFQIGQVNSFPNIMSQMMAPFGGGSFTQPMMADNVGGMLLNGNQILGPRLYFNGTGPATVTGTPTTEVTNILSGPFNNVGVPGAKSFHLLAPGYGNLVNLATNSANPYFVRFASSPSATVIGDAMAMSPTFFSLWIGNNDVLGYATSGGDGSNPITDVAMFTQAYTALVTTLTSGGAKGIVANIPYVTSIPHFTTVAHNPVPLNAASVTQLNTALFGPLIQILTALGQPNRLSLLQAGNNNPLLILDETLTDLSAQITGALQLNGVPAAQAQLMGNLYGRARHATASDLVTLSTSSSIGTTNFFVPAPFNTIGVTYPLRDSNVLIPSEQTAIKNATDAYNAVIANLATANNLALLDANTLLTQMSTTGLKFGDFTFTSNLVFGGAFSLDGVHLTARGYSFIAYKMLEAIDAKYGTNFKKSGNVPSPNNYPTNYPNGI